MAQQRLIEPGTANYPTTQLLRLVHLVTDTPHCAPKAGFWPLADLRLITPLLTLELPSEANLDGVGAAAFAGIDDPAQSHQGTSWAKRPPHERAVAAIQGCWRTLGNITPEKWALPFVVLHENNVVGMQVLLAREFSVCRHVETSSWLALPHQGKGIGTHMRAAVLEFAFSGLGARVANTAAVAPNAASLGVSRKLGYRDNGNRTIPIGGEPVVDYQLRLDREHFKSDISVRIDNLEPCLPLLGVAVDTKESPELL